MKKKKKDAMLDRLFIDTTKKPTHVQVMFIAGGLNAIAKDSKHKPRDRELCRVASAWLVNLGTQLYHEYKDAILNEKETTQENNHQPGAN